MPELSIIIPVFKECDVIRGTIESILRRDDYSRGRIEIIVIDGEKEATTIKAVEDYDIVRLSSEKGRGVQMNAGAAKAKGDILLFLHADSRLPGGALKKIINVIERNGGLGAFRLSIDSNHFFFRIIEWTSGIRCSLSGIPYGDQAFFIKKETFNRAGGFADIPIMEDVEFVKRIKRNGIKVTILKDRVITSARRWEKKGYLKTLLINRLVSILYSLNADPADLAILRGERVKNGLIVFVKYPEEGMVKTRIGSVLGDHFTIDLYRSFVADIIQKAARLSPDLLVYFTPEERALDFRNWLGLKISIFPQKGNDLGERMKNALKEQFGLGYGRLVLIGSDIPHIPAGRLNRSLRLLRKKGAVIGPAEDGGYYLIGFNSRHFLPEVFDNIPWSTSSVFSLTLRVLADKEIKTALLPRMRDIDTVHDLKKINLGSMPRTREFLAGPSALEIRRRENAKI